MDSDVDTPLNLSIHRGPSMLPEHNKFHHAAENSPFWPFSMTIPHLPEHFDTTSSMAYSSSASSTASPPPPLNHATLGKVVLTPIKCRGPKNPVPEFLKDERYFKRRCRNNEAAKRSRQARKDKQEAEFNRMALIEVENARLRAQIISLRAEYETLAQLVAMRDKCDFLQRDAASP